MKITKSQLKQTIEEEIMRAMREDYSRREPAGPGERTPSDSDYLQIAAEEAVEAVLEDAERPMTEEEIIVDAWGGGGGEYGENPPAGWREEVKGHLEFMEDHGKVEIVSYYSWSGTDPKRT